MKKVFLFLILFISLNVHCQTDNVITFRSYSQKYADHMAKKNKGAGEQGGTPNLSNIYTGLNLSKLDLSFSEDWPSGSYRLYLRLSDNCKLYFDEKQRVTNRETNSKFDMKKSEVEKLNEALSLVKTEYYYDDKLISDCKNSPFVIPITISF